MATAKVFTLVAELTTCMVRYISRFWIKGLELLKEKSSIVLDVFDNIRRNPISIRVCLMLVSSERRYSLLGAIRFLRRSLANEGFFSLWRGNSATLVRVVPFAAIQYASHEQWKHVLNPTNDRCVLFFLFFVVRIGKENVQDATKKVYHERIVIKSYIKFVKAADLFAEFDCKRSTSWN